MRNIRFSVFRRSLFAKFTLSFILVGLIPLSALGYLAFNMISRQASQYTENQLNQMMLYLSQNVEQKFTEYDNVTKLMYTNADLYDQLYQALTDQSDYQGFDHSVVINDYLKNLLAANQYIRNVIFVSKDSQEVYSLSRGTMPFQRNQFLWRKWSSDFEAEPKKLHYIDTHPEVYYAGSGNEVFTFVRQFMDKNLSLYREPPVMGILFIDIDLRAIDSLFASIKLNARDEVSIVDRSGKVVYSNLRDMRSSARTEDAPQGGTLKLRVPVSGTEFELVGSFYKRELYSNLLIVRDWTGIIAASCFVILTALAVVFSKRLSRPIREIIRQMGKAESGNLELHVPVSSMDEVGQLARGFNRMAVRLREFIRVAYLAEIKQKQAELNALKSQIRPHYLYNTLEVIRMSAVAHDVRPVADMIRSLSSQLEYVLDYGQNLVTIEQELQHVHHYFQLIRVRYDDLIRLEIEGLDRIQPDWQILKLSIQPLVENAVQHGLWPKPEGGLIRIRFEQEPESRLLVSVMDDGVGMSETQLSELACNLEQQSADQLRKHVGLQNVHDRLRTLMGASYGLELDSRPDEGTVVRFRMPIQKEERSLD